MKRYLALLLALVMLLSLAACTKAPAQTADEQTPETTGTTETAFLSFPLLLYLT